ncbi:UTRA domain-containing protein [Streptomyces olivaceiscleroticus]|uniref:UbiC transcription regulator-associated domain-containing protein n=1 Tax=Streptomyces olivaceiscleroticus TaxID=68245 RepID=A0ABN0ZMP0_9ACTN
MFQTARSATHEEIADLGVAPGTVCLVMKRVYRTADGRVVECTTTVDYSGRFRTDPEFDKAPLSPSQKHPW